MLTGGVGQAWAGGTRKGGLGFEFYIYLFFFFCWARGARPPTEFVPN